MIILLRCGSDSLKIKIIREVRREFVINLTVAINEQRACSNPFFSNLNLIREQLWRMIYFRKF